ncbi:MAG TPA: hypothetical protein VJN18_27960, partial [Polyangiaceae bacterium]|nr:hypothetical protein [Polyangiaceae bacterium]
MDTTSNQPSEQQGPWRFWTSLPLYARILVGLLLGLVVGVVVGPGAKPLELPAQLILRVLGALAPPLIL